MFNVFVDGWKPFRGWRDPESDDALIMAACYTRQEGVPTRSPAPRQLLAAFNVKPRIAEGFKDHDFCDLLFFTPKSWKLQTAVRFSMHDPFAAEKAITATRRRSASTGTLSRLGSALARLARPVTNEVSPSAVSPSRAVVKMAHFDLGASTHLGDSVHFSKNFYLSNTFQLLWRRGNRARAGSWGNAAADDSGMVTRFNKTV